MAGADRTPIVVAVIGLAGVLATAVLTNWDKIAPHPHAAAQTATVPVAGAQDLAAAQDRALGGATAALNGVADRIDAANTVQIAGTWKDDDGFRYDFTQRGGDYDFKQTKDGRSVGGGHGKLDGAAFTHDFTAQDAGAGRCTGQIAADGRSAAGSCRGSDGKTWSFEIHR